MQRISAPERFYEEREGFIERRPALKRALIGGVSGAVAYCGMLALGCLLYLLSIYIGSVAAHLKPIVTPVVTFAQYTFATWSPGVAIAVVLVGGFVVCAALGMMSGAVTHVFCPSTPSLVILPDDPTLNGDSSYKNLLEKWHQKYGSLKLDSDPEMVIIDYPEEQPLVADLKINTGEPISDASCMDGFRKVFGLGR